MDLADDRILIIEGKQLILRKRVGKPPVEQRADRIFQHERRPRVRHRPHRLDQVRPLIERNNRGDHECQPNRPECSDRSRTNTTRLVLAPKAHRSVRLTGDCSEKLRQAAAATPMSGTLSSWSKAARAMLGSKPFGVGSLRCVRAGSDCAGQTTRRRRVR
jgi:hypothetical protein